VLKCYNIIFDLQEGYWTVLYGGCISMFSVET
jgi:hypothetical protein